MSLWLRLSFVVVGGASVYAIHASIRRAIHASIKRAGMTVNDSVIQLSKALSRTSISVNLILGRWVQLGIIGCAGVGCAIFLGMKLLRREEEEEDDDNGSVAYYHQIPRQGVPTFVHLKPRMKVLIFFTGTRDDRRSVAIAREFKASGFMTKFLLDSFPAALQATGVPNVRDIVRIYSDCMDADVAAAAAFIHKLRLDNNIWIAVGGFDTNAIMAARIGSLCECDAVVAMFPKVPTFQLFQDLNCALKVYINRNCDHEATLQYLNLSLEKEKVYVDVYRGEGQLMEDFEDHIIKDCRLWLTASHNHPLH